MSKTKNDKKDEIRLERIFSMKKWLKSVPMMNEQAKPWKSLARKTLKGLKNETNN